MANLQYLHPESKIKCVISPYTNARAEIWKGYMVKMVRNGNELMIKPTFFRNKLKAVQYKDKLLKEI
jgi:hypothetical protein